MTIEHVLSRPLEELARQLEKGVNGFDLGIFPSSLKTEQGELFFTYCNIPGKSYPYRTEFDTVKKTLTVFYDIASGSVLGSAPCSARIPIPRETRTIAFDLDNADSVDRRTGKRMKDLNQHEFLEHFFPNLKRGEYEVVDPDQIT